MSCILLILTTVLLAIHADVPDFSIDFTPKGRDMMDRGSCCNLVEPMCRNMCIDQKHDCSTKCNASCGGPCGPWTCGYLAPGQCQGSNPAVTVPNNSNNNNNNNNNNN